MDFVLIDGHLIRSVREIIRDIFNLSIREKEVRLLESQKLVGPEAEVESQDKAQKVLPICIVVEPISHSVQLITVLDWEHSLFLALAVIRLARRRIGCRKLDDLGAGGYGRNSGTLLEKRKI